MDPKTKNTVKTVAKTGIHAVSDIFFLVVKAMVTVLLISITSAAIFACIFLVYLKNNIVTELGVRPEDFDISRSSVICYIDSETGQEVELVTLQSTEFRILVEYKEIPQHLIDALVSIEDHRFFKHDGVDWFRTVSAFTNMFLGMKTTYGGSTITQQLIKNMTKEDDATVRRKLQEIFRALEYEKRYDKKDILELYLNLVYFGHGCYGIGAAADYYFGKDVSQLTLAEASSIVGITNNPSMYSPYANKEANKGRQELILAAMLKYEYITEQEYTRVKNTRLNFKRGDNYTYEDVVYTWFEEAVIRDATRDLMNERDLPEALARRLLFTQGYRIIATLDPEMQAVVDSIYEHPELLPKVTGSAQQLQSGIVIADPYTGEIKALSGGVGAKTKNMLLSRATMTRRPPGSSIKPIATYAPAMEQGILTADTRYEDSESVFLNGTTWMPKNADRSYRGVVTVREAIRLSLNTTPAIVLDALTPSFSFRFLRDALGIDLNPNDENYAPLAAGQLTNGATVREMTSAFTMFPNSGQRTELRTYTKIYDENNDIVIDNTAKYTDAISDITAYWMTDMLHGAVTGGTGGAANLGSMLTAGKTGTSSDSKDRWFVGFTPYYIAAVWTGYDRPAVISASANPAAQIWKMVMQPIHEGLEAKSFSKPDNVTQKPVPGVSYSKYTIRCVDTAGEVILEQSDDAIPNRTHTVQAPAIDGYTLVGEPSAAILVTNDPSRNIAVFTYESDETEPPESTDNPDDPNNPNDPNANGDPDGTGITTDPNDPSYYPPDPGDVLPEYPPDPGDVTPGENNGNSGGEIGDGGSGTGSGGAGGSGGSGGANGESGGNSGAETPPVNNPNTEAPVGGDAAGGT